MAEVDLKIQPNVLSQTCASRRALALVSARWTPLVVFALAGGPQRHAELMRAIEGVSQKVLTKTLRTMERDGLVAREVHADDPPRHVEYRLTPLGESLAAPLVGLCRWAMDNVDAMQNARMTHGAPLL